MKEDILSNLDNPGPLEKLYRANKSAFKQEFNTLYPEIKNSRLATFWNERLNYESAEIFWGTRNELVFVIIAALVAGIIAKIPAFLTLDEDFYYPRNIGFIVFPVLTAYFAWKNHLSLKKIALLIGATAVALIYINSLPANNQSDTLILACIHLPIFLWTLLSLAFSGDEFRNHEKKLGFLRYNGDLLVMTALILIAGFIMSGITIGLFSLIGLQIEQFYFNYVGIFGLAAAPIIGTYLTQTNPQLVSKVSPVIAKIFSPLVLVMLVVYIFAIIYSGKDPYNDREFLLIFNALLVGVMALIFFSVAESTQPTKNKAGIWVLFLLSCVTVVVNGIALSAIVFRISEWGITPNRLAVLGSNILILLNLLLVTARLSKSLNRKANLSEVGKLITSFLPVYSIWALLVIFLFPLLFSFK